MHEKIFSLIISFSYIHFVNCMSEIGTTTPKIDAFVSGYDSIDNYPNTFFNQTVKIDGEDMVFRVLNGRPAQYGSVPYQVGMFKRLYPGKLQVFCGGSIISRQKVLSAAHCFMNKQKKYFFQGKLSKTDFHNTFVVAGYLVLNEKRSAQWRRIRRGHYPKTFRFPKDDIALIYTVRPFSFNANVSPIPYASVTIDYSGNCLISGYGKTSSNQLSDRLLLAEVEVLSDQRCRAIHKQDMRKFVCTSDVVSNVNKGDSGGPIVCQNTGDPNDQGKGVQVGITCGRRYLPTTGASPYFTRISYFTKFISRCSSLRPSYAFVILNFLINSFSLF